MIIDASTLDATSAYKLLIGSIIPRAIGWVSTLSPSGVANLAPISFFTAVGRMPPMVTLPQAHFAHRTAFEFAPEVDEFDAVGLEKEACEVVRVPRVKGAPIAMECKLERIIPIGDLGDHVVFGEVVRFHIRDDIYLDRGRIDIGALAAVGRLAAEYSLVNNVFTTPLESGLLDSLHGRRMARLDGQASDFSPSTPARGRPRAPPRPDPHHKLNKRHP